MKAQNFACKMNDKIRHQRLRVMPPWAYKDNCFRCSFVIAVSISSFILDDKVRKAYTFANAFSRCETRSPKANIIAELQKIFCGSRRYICFSEISSSQYFFLHKFWHSQISLVYLNAPSGLKTNLTNSCCLVKRKLWNSIKLHIYCLSVYYMLKYPEKELIYSLFYSCIF